MVKTDITRQLGIYQGCLSIRIQRIKKHIVFAWTVKVVSAQRTAREKHYKYHSSDNYVKVKMPSEKEKWLKFQDDQYQYKGPFMLYTNLESLLKSVYDQHREKINQIKTERKG